MTTHISIVLLVMAILSLATAAFLAAPAGGAPTTATSPSPATTTQPGDGPTETIHRAALAWFDQYLSGDAVDKLVPPAEAAAEKILAGGAVYLAGDPGFTDEMYFRAGGFAGSVVWTGQKITEKDVLIIGLLDQTSKASRYLTPAWIGQARGNISPALTVHIASAQWPQAAKLKEITDPKGWKNGLHMLDTAAPDGGAWSHISLGQMATVAVARAFEAEVAAAITRKGKTPAMLASVWEPGGSDFDGKIRGKATLDQPELKAIPAGKLGREYLTACRRQIAAFLTTNQAPAVRQAAARLADCQKRKGTILAVADGHIHYRGDIISSQLSRLLFYGPIWQYEPGQGLAKGDTLLFVGYLKAPDKLVPAALAAGADVVVMTVEDGPADPNVTTIRSCWEPYDSVVELPGYPYKIEPSSSVVQTPQWYSLMAEAEALLKK